MGAGERVLVAETEGEGEGAGERELVAETEGEGAELLVALEVVLARAVAAVLPETRAVRETLGEVETEGVRSGEPVPSGALGEELTVTEGCAPLGEPLAVAHALRLGLTERLKQALAVGAALPVRALETVPEGVAEPVELLEGAPEAEGSAVADPPVALAVRAPEALASEGEGERAALGEALPLPLARGEALTEALPLPPALADAEPEGERAGEGEGEARALAESQREPDGEPLGEGSEEEEGVPEALGVVEGQ